MPGGGFAKILEVFSKPERDDDLKPLACGHICQIPNVVRDKCCQCANAKRKCNHCRGGEHVHTLHQERTYCDKHDVPVGRDKNGICSICQYKDDVTSSGSKALKLYKKSPWLKRQAVLKKEKNQNNGPWWQWSKKQKRIMWRERYPMCKCHFVHICTQIKKFPNPYDWKTENIHMEWNSDKGYRCPYGNNPCQHNVVKKKQPSKPAINTLQTIDEFADLAEEQDVWSENRKTNDDDVESQEMKTRSDTKKSVCEEFSRDAITWPSLGDIDTGDRSLRDWVVFQNGEISDVDDDNEDNSDTFSLISEPFSESSWVDLTPATTTKKKPKKQLSFAEMLKRKSKNNFTNQLKTVAKTNFAIAKDVYNSKMDERVEENAIDIEKLKGAHRNHATKNSRKGFIACKKWSGRRGVKSKRSKNSIRRRVNK